MEMCNKLKYASYFRSLSATGLQSNRKESTMLLFLPTLLLFVLVTVMVKSLLLALLLLLLLESLFPVVSKIIEVLN